MKKTIIPVLLAAVVLSTGCASNQVNSRTYDSTVNVAGNAAIGGIGGAAVGAVVGDSSKAATRGAALGAVIMGGASLYKEITK